VSSRSSARFIMGFLARMLLVSAPTVVLGFSISSFRPPLAGVSRTRHTASIVAMAGEPIEVDDTWTTTASGLQYLDEKVGGGESLDKGNVVNVDYTGWTESNGKQFDTSDGRGPLSFAVGTGRVIPGWDEGVLGMKVGGKRRLSIPADLAYGENGAGPEIPPNSRLQFVCELQSVSKGFEAFAATFPGGKVNIVLGTVLLLSFIPYFLPEEMKPSAWM